jgi:hypothetical protein
MKKSSSQLKRELAKIRKSQSEKFARRTRIKNLIKIRLTAFGSGLEKWDKAVWSKEEGKAGRVFIPQKKNMSVEKAVKLKLQNPMSDFVSWR